ncbi:MFS transporter [Desulforudis sp. 1088]|uniref:MFS transporter n=1 Tax=unclassified Candidatus Desulforudis TaxID=2635950 RepID=UPI003CE5726F
MTREDGGKRQAFKFIVLLGVVSLFADFTYEGARSISGPFLALLGASGLIVGLVSGFGEFLGYGLRLVSGYWADRTRRYWLLTAFGYGINLLAVPALALAGRWETAAGLLILERMGKGLRTPARDAMLSFATSKTGRGWGFAIHEALDQVGALAGPLLAAAALYLGGNYRVGFGILLVPALLALGTLTWARQTFPAPHLLEQAPEVRGEPRKPRLPRVFWLYVAFTAVTVGGFANYQIVSYHFKLQGVVSDVQIPVLYAVAMGVDAVVALLAGRFYDRAGLGTLIAVPLLVLPLPWLIFGNGYLPALAGMVLWGAVMGIQETTMRAAVADMVGPGGRAFAYGIFNTAYGGAWMLGSVILGYLYDIRLAYVTLFIVALEVLALPLFWLVWRRAKTENPAA